MALVRGAQVVVMTLSCIYMTVCATYALTYAAALVWPATFGLGA